MSGEQPALPDGTLMVVLPGGIMARRWRIADEAAADLSRSMTAEERSPPTGVAGAVADSSSLRSSLHVPLRQLSAGVVNRRLIRATKERSEHSRGFSARPLRPGPTTRPY